MKRFFSSHWYVLSISLLLIFSFVIRAVKLDQIPAGMTWDEAAIGYNGYAIWETRRDEWLVKLPISFRSFGDYKAPLAIYLNGFFTYFLSFEFFKNSPILILQSIHHFFSYIFWLNLWTVRIPFVLSSVFGILGFSLLVRNLVKHFFYVEQKIADRISMVSGAMMSVSVWFFHFTRAGFESGMSLTFLIWMVYFLLRSISLLQSTKVKIVWRHYALLATSIFFLSASMYTYHSAKIVAPILFITNLVIFSNLKKYLFNTRIIILFVFGLLISVVLLRPMIVDTLQGSGGERFAQTSVFSSSRDSTAISKIGIMVGNYLRHMSPQFLFFGETTTLRHGDGQWGVLYLLDAVFILTVICLFWQKKGKVIEQKFQRKFLIFGLVWIGVGLLPAAIGAEIPHANRAIMALPGFLLLSSVGFFEIVELFPKNKNNTNFSIQSIVAYSLILGYLALTVSYMSNYFTRFSKESESDFYYGYIEAMEFAKKHEDESEKILFTSRYGQPYIYALFVRKTNPIWYQGGSLIKYEFTDRISQIDLQRQNTLIIATPDEIDAKFADELIIAPDGMVKFVLVLPKK